MKKKELEILKREEITALLKKAAQLRNEIATLFTNKKTNPQKDTNLIIKKRNELSIILSIIREKQLYGKTT